MKILIATGLYPPDIGGPATMLEALAKSFQKKGLSVRIITYADCREAIAEEDAGGITIYRVSRRLSGLTRHIFYLYKMWRLSAGWADLIYATDTYSVGYFAYLMKKILKKKYIIRFVGDSAWETSTNNGWITDPLVGFEDKKYCDKIEVLKRRRRIILTNADRVIVVSNFLAGIARKIGVLPENIKVIYNSIDFMETGENLEKTEEIKQRYGEGKRIRTRSSSNDEEQNLVSSFRSKIIVTACRLTPWKGVDKIIEILPRLKEKVGDISFLVLGDGPLRERLENSVRGLDLEGDVYFLGKIEHDDILDYFKAADLFILNSNYEGLSHTLLEAMKAGAPILASDVGGNPEVIENGKEGLLVGYGDNEELLEAAARMLTDNELARKFVENASEKLKVFNWEKAVMETLGLINDVCRRANFPD